MGCAYLINRAQNEKIYLIFFHVCKVLYIKCWHGLQY